MNATQTIAAAHAAAKLTDESRLAGTVLLIEHVDSGNATTQLNACRDILRNLIHWLEAERLDVASELRYAQQDVRRERVAAGIEELPAVRT